MKNLKNGMKATWEASTDGRVMIRVSQPQSSLVLKRWSMFYAAFAISMALIQWVAPAEANASVYSRSTLAHQPELLDIAHIKTVLKNSKKMVRHCYERALKRQPQLEGQLGVQFTIGSKGHVVKVSVVDDTLQNRRVSKCITKRVSKWRFPSPEDGEVTVYSPFVMSPLAG